MISSWASRGRFLKQPIAIAALLTAVVCHGATPAARQSQGGYLGESPDRGFRPLDEAAYDGILRRRHMDLTRDQLITSAEQEYQRIESEMIPLAREIDSTKSWHQILHGFEQTSHPRAVSDIIPTYQAELQRAQQFILKHDVLTLPRARELPVLPTPGAWVSTFPYAVYRFHEDVLLVTLAVPNGSDEETLRSHNYGLIAVAAVHEAYPGHRVQNLVHPLAATNEETETFMEGWGLYSEELMLRAGYYDSGPRERKLFAMRMLLWRAARALLDGRLHRGAISPAQAVTFLTDNIGLSKNRAQIEVETRYIGSPVSAATYLVGKRQIEQLRRQVEAAEGTRFTEKSFHDRLLAQGAQPVQEIARRAFNMELQTARGR